MSVRPCEMPKQKQVLLRVKSDGLPQRWLGQGQRRQDLRSILERGFVKRTGVKNAIRIHTMDKLNISLLPLVSFQLLHPATSELFLPLPNRLLVQLFRMIASFLRPRVLDRLRSRSVYILYLSIAWFQILPYCIPFASTLSTATIAFWPRFYWSIPWDPEGRSIYEILSNPANEDQSVQITPFRR